MRGMWWAELLNIIAGTLSVGTPPPPSSPVAGYYVWLDAADTSTITQASGAVSQWTDKSANAFAFTQATAAYKPSTNVDTQNSKNVLTWGANDLLESTAVSSTWKFLHYAAHTVFIAFKQTSNGSAAGLLQTNAAASANIGFYMWHQPTSVFQHQISYGVSGNTVAINSTGSVLTTNFGYVTVIGDPQNGTAANRSDIRVLQGAAIKNNVATNAAANLSPTTTLRIGDYIAGGGVALTGTLGEIIIYNSILSAGDILLNQQYLAAKWGV